jgi:hypothetical protein
VRFAFLNKVCVTEFVTEDKNYIMYSAFHVH